MSWVRAAAVVCLLPTLAGCQTPAGPVFAPVSPALVWPPPPDPPRIRHIGELRGQASLDVRPSGWEALRAAVAGPRPSAEFVRPSAVAVAGERVYVADAGLGVVHLLDLAARRYQMIRGAPRDPLRVPIDLTVAGDKLLVVDRGRATLDVFDLNGGWQATQRWPEITAPVAVAWDAAARRIWLADAAAHACFSVTDSYVLAGRVGARGGEPGQFNYPRALAVHPSLGLAVVDAMNFRVQVVGETGAPVAVFGKKGDAAGDFAQPRDVAVDSDGHCYVLDNQFENVQVFDVETRSKPVAARLLLAFGQGGDGRGEFSLPSGITIDEQDRIWIADSYNRRVQVFQYLSEKAACAE